MGLELGPVLWTRADCPDASGADDLQPGGFCNPHHSIEGLQTGFPSLYVIPIIVTVTNAN